MMPDEVVDDWVKIATGLFSRTAWSCRCMKLPVVRCLSGNGEVECTYVLLKSLWRTTKTSCFFFVEEKTTKIGRQGDTNKKRLL